MKKYLSYFLLPTFALALVLSFTACSDNNEPGEGGGTTVTLTEQEEAIQALTGQYVNQVIFPTYTNLAAKAQDLYTQLGALTNKFKNTPASVTDAEIKNVCNTFLAARAYWEESEAFLYGAATDFGIDPHIDTWPLDRSMLAGSLKDADFVESLEGEDGIAVAHAQLNEQLGFHGIEFILFRDGLERTAAALRGEETDDNFVGTGVTGLQELVFATAVAGDLRDYCWELEVSWLGDAAPAAHVERVEDLGYNTTLVGSDNSYGENMLNATKAGSTFASWRQVTTTILVAGCSNICQEVADQKMGQAYRATTGTGSEDDSPEYIESPYSKRSFDDFYDNIESIKNSLYGNINGQSAQSSSIMSYLNKYNPTMATELQNKLTTALQKLTECKISGKAFVDQPNGSWVKAAMDAIDELDDQLNLAAQWIQRN